ncbi:MAG: aromatic ring-hydroxylating dioxygenase subunit alpha [Burkholderiaceae bacterium]|jgi:phenylpropionate dioxygenase-like ring-hydroxylating dioxygenase large terminal subunit
MSDLGSRTKLARSTAQLPVSSYFEESLFRRELEMLFKPGPGYVGHELMVPQCGDYHTLPQERDGRILVRNESGIELLSNVCRHRQAIMLSGRGRTDHIVCPLHRWTYDLGGGLKGAPYFSDKPCLNLEKRKLSNWKGLLFEGARDVDSDMAALAVADFNFEGYVFDRLEIHECPYNWKTFIEVYLEDYHVGPFHPGLGQFVTCDDLRWEFGERYSVQTLGVNAALARPGTPKYKYWHEQVLKFNNGAVPHQGAIWLTMYPNVMLEWYPHVLVVSTLFPHTPQSTTNIVEFYYPEEIALFERDFVEAEQAAYMETCAEDDEIAIRMDAGRRALMERGVSEIGPYQSPMEDGMQHFHEWWREAMNTPG